jgi:hypothetical protein
MKRYRTKPVEVSAFQFDPCGEHKTQLPEGVVGIASPGADNWAYYGCKFYVTVRMGEHFYRSEIKRLDWVIVSDDGTWRVCRREAFEQGFELVVPMGVAFVSEHIR